MTKTGDTYKDVNPNTSAGINFYQYISCTIQQAGSNIEREKLEDVLLAKLAYMQRWYVVVMIVSVSLKRNNSGVGSFYRCFHNIAPRSSSCIYA